MVDPKRLSYEMMLFRSIFKRFSNKKCNPYVKNLDTSPDVKLYPDWSNIRETIRSSREGA